MAITDMRNRVSGMRFNRVGKWRKMRYSQTDTYLNAGPMGLHESMKRFDAIRCTTVAHESLPEQRPLSNADSRQPANDLLH